MTQYIGKIIFHDYGYGISMMPEEPADTAAWKAKLDPALRTIFEQLERTLKRGGD